MGRAQQGRAEPPERWPAEPSAVQPHDRIRAGAMNRRLIHYSPTPLTEVRTVAPFSNPLANPKPCGLWVSAEGDDDWLQWCWENEFRLHHLQNPTEVVLRPDAEILRLSTPDDMADFERKYLRPGCTRFSYAINPVAWDMVASRYQGIIIAPYVGAWRHKDSMWYYGWDCASGCIWDARAVDALVPVQ